MADGRIIIDTKLDSSGLEQGLRGLQTILKTGLGALGLSSLSKVIGSIAAETKALNDSVRKASTLFGDASVNTDALKKKMTDLAMATGSSSEEIGEALYNALSAGVEATDDMGTALSFVEKSIKTSKAGFADLASTVTATASVLNAYGMATEEADRVQGILLQTQNLGITTVAELSATLAQVVPTASAFGVSFEQVGASLATMTAQGTKTAQATTSLNSLLAELGKSGMKGAENLKKAGEYAGVGAKGFAELIDEGYTISDVLQMMEKYAKDNGMSLVDMFGSIEAGKASLQLASIEGEKFKDSLARMSDTAGLVEQGFNTVLSSAERLRNTFSELKKIIGEEFAGVVSNASEGIADFLEAIVKNGEEASLLKRYYNELANAVYEYNKAQENTAGVSKELYEAQKAQASINLGKSLLKSVSIYNQATDSIEKLKEENIKLEQASKTAYEGIEKTAKEFGYTLDDVAKMASTGELFQSGHLSDLALAWEDCSKVIIDSTSKIASNNQLLAESEQFVAEYMKDMLTLAQTGALDLDTLKVANYGLYEAVATYGDYLAIADKNVSKFTYSIEELEKWVRMSEEAMANSTTEAEFAMWAGLADGYRKALEEALKAQEALAEGPSTDTGSEDTVEGPSQDVLDAWDNLNKKLEDSDKIAQAFGDSYNHLDEKISIATSGIKNLIALGVDPADEKIQSLIQQIELWEAQLEGVTVKTDPVLEIYKRMNSELELAEKKNIALGDSYDLVSEKISIYEKAIEDMVENGINPSGATVKKLREEIETLKKSLEEPVEDVPIVNEIDEAYDDINKRLSDAKKNSEALGESFNLLSEQASIATSGIKSLISMGVDPADEKITNLLAVIEAHNNTLATETDKAYSDIQKRMSDAEKTAETLGDSFNLMAEKSSIATSGIKTLISMGVEPADERIQSLLKILQENATVIEDETTVAYEELLKRLDDADKNAEAFGDSFDLLGSKISIATSGVQSLISMGLDPTDERIKSLVADIKEWTEASKTVVDETFNLDNALADMKDELTLIDSLEQALGDNYDDNSAKISLYKKAIEEFIKKGIDPASDVIKEFNDALEELLNGKGSSEEGGIFSGLFDGFKDAESAGKTLGGVLADSMGAFVDEISNAGKKLEDLGKKLTSVNSDLEDDEKKKLELQEELADAQARGDAKAIENAEKKIEDLDELIVEHKNLKKELEKEKESVEDGSEAWKAFGKSALMSLAEILEGIGHELTARAVTSVISARFGDAIVATAGAIGAYTASALIKTRANSFASGGIVKQERGLSPNGDNHIAYVNPGELILNQAQQNNLADQIRAMNEGLGAGGNIIISLSGAYIYGLDEPAVGRAIYDNIERLRSEGVL